jgi:hypothetical protein
MRQKKPNDINASARWCIAGVKKCTFCADSAAAIAGTFERDPAKLVKDLFRKRLQ